MKYLRNIYYPAITYLSRICGYNTGPMLHYMFTALLAVFFIYGYFSSIAGIFKLDFFILAMGVILPGVVIIHFISFGGLHRLGIPSVYKLVRRIDDKMDGNQVKKDLSIAELEELLQDLTRLPILRLFTPLVDEFFYMVPVFLVNQYFYKMDVDIALIESAFIVLPMLMSYSFVTTDLYASVTRAHIRRRIYIKGGSPPANHALSLKIKGLIQLVVGIVSVYILLNLKELQIINQEHSGKVLMFSFMSLINVGLISYMLFYSVFQAISDLATAARMIEKGDNAGMFSGTSDLELVNLATGLLRASQTMLSHQKELEQKVQDRTKALEDKNSLLQDFRKSMIFELSLAADIQLGIYPKTKEWGPLKIDYLHRPLQPVSGDYYDVFTTEENVIILSADASGHGVPAALVTMAAKQALQEARLISKGTMEFLSIANRMLLDRIHTQDYLTIFALQVDKDGTMTYTNAAHPQPILYRNESSTVEILDTDGVSLGMMPEDDFRYEEKVTRLKIGDRILLFTDGVTELNSSKGEQYGDLRLIEKFESLANTPFEDILGILHEELENHLDGEVPRDDISMMLIEMTSQEEIEVVI